MKLTARPCRKEVFIVDDSPIVRERLVSLLSDIPQVVVVGQAERPNEAVRQIQKLRPAVVVLDISMPGGSGLSVLQEIKKGGAAPMVIMLTNFAQDPYRQKCMSLGADYFFDKSSEFDKVKGVLEGFSGKAAAPEKCSAAAV